MSALLITNTLISNAMSSIKTTFLYILNSLVGDLLIYNDYMCQYYLMIRMCAYWNFCYTQCTCIFAGYESDV
jgi:hypothetical protein